MVNSNQFLGLTRGPIDHNASSVINAVANGAIFMGSAVKLVAPPSGELLPRVEETINDTDLVYGVAVGGDADGIYGDDGQTVGGDAWRATTAAGQDVIICTQGRCLARTRNTGGGTIPIGTPLNASDSVTNQGMLDTREAANSHIARALQSGVAAGDFDIIAVDIQREQIPIPP